MANDLAGSQPAKELVALALDHRAWEATENRPGKPAEAIAIIDRWLVPMKEAQGLEGEGARRLVARLRLLGAKIAPSMSEEQVQVWLSAMAAALSDLPARVSIRAAEEALHVPAKFLNEVEGIVREKAVGVFQRYEVARYRLERMAREIENAKRPKLSAPEPLPEMTQEDFNGMALNDLGRKLLSLGLKSGHVTQEQFETAMARTNEQEGEI